MKTLILIALFISANAWGSSMYTCEDHGKKVFSQTPCTGKPLEVKKMTETAASDAPDGVKVCLEGLKTYVNFKDNANVVAEARGKSNMMTIDYMGSRFMARMVTIGVSIKADGGGTMDSKIYRCYLSPDERRVLKFE